MRIEFIMTFESQVSCQLRAEMTEMMSAHYKNYISIENVENIASKMWFDSSASFLITTEGSCAILTKTWHK